MVNGKCDLLHELLNSLTVVVGECELLQEKASAEANQRLTIIHEKANRMTALIRQYQCPIPQQESQPEGLVRSLVRTAFGR